MSGLFLLDVYGPATGKGIIRNDLLRRQSEANFWNERKEQNGSRNFLKRWDNFDSSVGQMEGVRGAQERDKLERERILSRIIVLTLLI